MARNFHFSYFPGCARIRNFTTLGEGILLRCYSQNIDGLEGLTGLDPDKLVEAHGSFSASHCTRCRLEIDNDLIFPGNDILEAYDVNCLHFLM